jgi:uncharacterized protein (TIGR00725 family)
MPGEQVYQNGIRLGELLAQAGFSVITGGYIGVMEAVSRGAAGAGGHVIGITCDEIEAWRPVHKNAWVIEERRYATLRERLFALIDSGDAMLVMPGGPGTLAEVALVWNHLIIDAIPARPLILIGAGWQKTMQVFFEQQAGFIPAAQRDWLLFAATVEEAMERLQGWDGAVKRSVNGHSLA